MSKREELQREYAARLSTAVTVQDLAAEVANCLATLADQRQPEAGRGETVGTPVVNFDGETEIHFNAGGPVWDASKVTPDQAANVVRTLFVQAMSRWARSGCTAADADAFEKAVDDFQAAAVERATKAMREELAKVERELARVKKEHVPAKPPAGMSVREAARKRYALLGSDAQALEGAISLTERERDANATAANELAELRALAKRIDVHGGGKATALAPCICLDCERFRALLHLDREGT